jgi:uracil-DNA glycosylase family 4
MLKPLACEGCPHYSWAGFLRNPQPLGSYGVMLIGEALGETEAAEGRPFAGKAGFLLDKLIRHAGLQRAGFGIANAVFCRPPDNKLAGEPYEASAVYQCRERHLLPLLRSTLPRVLVPMGATALSSLLGRKDILDARGYVWDQGPGGALVYPTVHPSFILRGNGNYGTVFIHDLQRAVEVARDGWHPAPTDHYLLDPTPADALVWVEEYLRVLERDPHTYLAYDIETPYNDADKEEGSLEDEDASYTILRIGFAYRPGAALSIPWNGSYLAAISRALGSPGPKVVWNDGFDSPRIRAASVPICGPVHDGMVAWHVLESDLPKSLRFVSSMLLPNQGPWKHLSKERPAFYNAVDADVEGQLIHVIFEKLREAQLWSVYDRHILQLTPILARLSARGMPIDPVRRASYARLLDERQSEVLGRLQGAVPLAARKVEHVFKAKRGPNGQSAPPKGAKGDIRSRPALIAQRVCDACGKENPGKPHFKVFKKKVNPCSGAGVKVVQTEGLEWYRLAPFKPSKDQLGRYCEVARIKPISRRTPDGYKVTFDENAIRTLCLRHPDDPLFKIILDYREVDKIAGTYIGRPATAGVDVGVQAGA